MLTQLHGCPDEQLHQGAATFLGDILQQPPMYSAIKIKGERLYKAARRGEDVERASRPVHISAFDLARGSDGSRDVSYRVVCSKGTYVRSLIHDLVRASSPLKLGALSQMHRHTHMWCDTVSLTADPAPADGSVRFVSPKADSV